MRRAVCLTVLLLTLTLCVGRGVARAQTLNIFDDVVKQSLNSLLKKLQSNGAGALVLDRAASDLPNPFKPSLRDLGPPVQILLSRPVLAQGLLNYNARVIHQRGISEWRIGALKTGQIAAYSYTTSESRHGNSALGPLSDLTFNDRGSLTKTFSWGRKPDSTANIFNDEAIFRARPSISSSPPQGPPIAVAPAAPVVDPRVVEFLFASTRHKSSTASESNVSYDGQRASTVTFGAASVRIPDDHKIGRIELPSSWKFLGIIPLGSSLDEHKHFVVKRVVELSKEAFSNVIRESGAKSALVFVHGFDNSFEDALYRNAQIVWDLQYKGLSILFTWASRGKIGLTDYIYDRTSAEIARADFIGLIESLRRDYGIEKINVLAHSMGNFLVLGALSNYAQTSNPVRIARFIMAAPDIDRDEFIRLEPKAHAIVGGMTLYASSADKALELSRKLAGDIPRAGDVPSGGPIVLNNVETIDVTAVGNDVLGLNHDTFASSRDVIEDISAMLKRDAPSPRLIQIRPMPEPPAPRRYWRYVP